VGSFILYSSFGFFLSLPNRSNPFVRDTCAPQTRTTLFYSSQPQLLLLPHLSTTYRTHTLKHLYRRVSRHLTARAESSSHDGQASLCSSTIPVLHTILWSRLLKASAKRATLQNFQKSQKEERKKKISAFFGSHVDPLHINPFPFTTHREMFAPILRDTRDTDDHDSRSTYPWSSLIAKGLSEWWAIEMKMIGKRVECDERIK